MQKITLTKLIVLITTLALSSVAYSLTVEQAQKNLSRVFPSVKVSSVKPTTLPRLYEIIVNGKPFYLNADGTLMLDGKIHDAPDTKSPKTNTLTLEQAQKYIKRILPQAKINAMKPTPLAGFYELVSDGKILYLNSNGTFIGTEMYNLTDAVNLTRQSYNTMRRDVVKNIKEDQILAYTPKDYKYTVHVFTDMNCSYCKKFHSEINSIMKLGIRINYLLFDNLGEDSYHKAVNVWCSKDRHAAFELGKQSKVIPQQKKCDHPVDKNRNLAKLTKVRTTPAFLFANGKLANGYRSPQVLLEELKEAQASDVN